MRFWLLPFCFFFLACSSSKQDFGIQTTDTNSPKFYSEKGREYLVEFEAIYKTSAKSLEELAGPKTLTQEVRDTVRYMFGPLTNRNWGGMQKPFKVQVQREKAYVKDGRVLVPYLFRGQWVLHISSAENLTVPLPFSAKDLLATDWLACTDSDPGHQAPTSLWYYWDPQRPGCKQVAGQDYQEAVIRRVSQTPQSSNTFPEYARMVRNENGKKVITMTFAFGYVTDRSQANPFTDNDEGMAEFRAFHIFTERSLSSHQFSKQELKASDLGFQGSQLIGSLYKTVKDNVEYHIYILASAGVDQMQLFAWSYARQKQSFFGWFGHSRSGHGFDAGAFQAILNANPRSMSITKDYQLLYWAGCNSYAYYTLPYFAQKAALNTTLDPQGTKNLDIISNALPSYFIFNALSAEVLLVAILNHLQPTSYQKIIQEIEGIADNSGYEVLVNILGDEDNS